jgi:LacI family transcriptional regulator
MATIDDVAQRAGVSAGTVSNVLNRPSYVKPETRARVQRAIEELGFVPARHARRYREGRERVLGLAMMDLRNPYFVEVALGAEEEAKRQGIGAVMCHNGGELEREQQNLDLLIQLRVQGIVAAPIDFGSPHLRVLHDRGIPIVYLDRIQEADPANTVAVDQVAGGRLAARHLVELGHRRLCFVGDPAHVLMRARLRGLREGSDGAGVGEIDVIATTDWAETRNWTVPDGLAAAAEFLSRPPADRATAVFCANDDVAKGFVLACLAAGLSVPGDVSVVGVDDMEWTSDFVVPLTTVHQPRPELGAEAVRLLQRIMDDPGRPVEHVVLDPTLVVRASTGTVESRESQATRR